MEIRKVDYYQIIKKIKFNDGFEANAGELVMLLEHDGDMLNVQMEHNKCKRIFWMEASNAKFKKTKEEKWSKAKVTEHEMDVNEKWLENEQQNTATKRKVSDGNTTPSKKLTTRKATRKSVVKKSITKRTGKPSKRKAPKKAIKKIRRRKETKRKKG